MLLLLILLPLMGSVPLLLVRSESETRLGRWSCAVTGLTLLVMVLAVCTRFGVSLDIPLCGIHFTLDGFRAIYGLVVSFMWFVSADRNTPMVSSDTAGRKSGSAAGGGGPGNTGASAGRTRTT